MNCNEFAAGLYSLDEISKESLTNELKQHIAACESCAQQYEETIDVMYAVKPRTEIQAPLLLKQSILQQLNENEMKSENKAAKVISLSSGTKKWLGVAATVVLIIMTVPFFTKDNHADASNAVFIRAINAADFIKTMQMKFAVRTTENEGFNSIDKKASMKEHIILKSFEAPVRWKVEKNGRAVLFNGSDYYVWLVKANSGYKSKRAEGVIEWMNLLLDPASILWREKENAAKSGASIETKESGNETHVSINSKAEGNFINDYLKDKSINQSDNRREYIFDKKSGLLKSLKIYLLEANKEVLIVDVSSIIYDLPLNDSAFTLNIPANVKWEAINEPVKDEAISSLTSKEFAELALNDLSKGDFEAHKEIWSMYKVFLKLMYSQYKGAEIIKTGTPFKSGTYAGEFVPYEMKLKNGEVKKFVLAVRNDNHNKMWMVDGGL